MNKTIILIAINLFIVQVIVAQNINWRSLKQDQRHIAYVNFGIEYGMTAQFGYSYHIRKNIPILLSTDYSFPMGNTLFDDHKVRIGGQIEALKLKNFSLTAKALMVYRRYANERVRIANFGMEFTAIAGYYKPKWYVAGEFGFDKSVASHMSHREAITDYYPEVTDGWYVPCGGNYLYGIQGGATILPTVDLNIRIGITQAQRQDEDATLPYYLQLGLIKRF